MRLPNHTFAQRRLISLGGSPPWSIPDPSEDEARHKQSDMALGHLIGPGRESRTRGRGHPQHHSASIRQTRLGSFNPLTEYYQIAREATTLSGRNSTPTVSETFVRNAHYLL